MTKRQAIRLEGEGAVRAFLSLVPGSRPSDNAKLGDAIVRGDGSDHYVEVKECHASAGEGGTINQVRPIKFIPCIIWAPNQECWYILSPDQLVLLAATKKGGQHTEIPFESMNFALGSLSGKYHSKAKDSELGAKVLAAIRRGVKAENMKELMASLLDDIIAIKMKYIEAVRRADKDAQGPKGRGICES
jgi:hypothetical protein